MKHFLAKKVTGINTKALDEDPETADPNAGLQDPVVIANKLRELVSSVPIGENGDKRLPVHQILASMAATAHMYRTFERRRPEYRRSKYRSADARRRRNGGGGGGGENVDDDAPPAPLSESELLELKEGLDFADLAYETKFTALRKKLKKRGFSLLRHDKATEPGRVAHYVAVHHERRLAVIGLKGTSTVADAVTDALGVVRAHDLDDHGSSVCDLDDEGGGRPEVNGITLEPEEEGLGIGMYIDESVEVAEFWDDAHRGYRRVFDEDYPHRNRVFCHEGMFAAAASVAEDATDLVEHLLLPQRYRVLVCGHSLGAGTACLLGLLLWSRVKALHKDKDHERLRVLAYATPACLNHRAGVACAPFVTSVVNNADLVPRATAQSLAASHRLWRAVSERLRERGMRPTSLSGARALARKLTSSSSSSDVDAADGNNDDDVDVDADADDFLLTPEEIEAALDLDDERDLDDTRRIFVPGRVVVAYRTGANGDGAPEAVVTDGGARPLRVVEPANTMLRDHFSSSYAETIDALLKIERERTTTTTTTTTTQTGEGD